ncbi:MAG: relaxase/mobilization nuclease domain-containing protein [Methylacidiphilales bacterium]|nr:relaxase/mobilization nuclease domain-containing protein [Candidatus Methylacidiphilales bacterium]
MVISFFGGERANVAYLVRNPTAMVLRGDPVITEELISTLDFSQRFCSGCLSFNEAITPEKVTQHIEEFEEAISSGLPSNAINKLWVRHTDKGRTELHFLMPQINLLSGRQLTIYLDARDRRLMNALRDTINLREGYTRPDDPSRKKMTSIPLRIAKASKDFISEIDALIQHEIAAGTITKRDDVVLYLEAQGYEIKRSKKGKLPAEYLKIKKHSDEKFTGLRGAYYRADFCTEICNQNTQPSITKRQELEEAMERLKVEKERRAIRQSARHEMAIRAEKKRQLRHQKDLPKTSAEISITPPQSPPTFLPTQQQKPTYETERNTNPFSTILGESGSFASRTSNWFGRAVQTLVRSLAGLFRAQAVAAAGASGLGGLSAAVDICCEHLVRKIGRFELAVGELTLDITVKRPVAKTRDISGPSL